MILYAITILVSAFLLFQVQPVIAKIILPWFGGSAAVWTTCLLFFQLALLLGYLYSHAVVRYLKPRIQMAVHMGLLLVSLAALPIYPSAALKPLGPEEPVLRILGVLAVTVGLPYFLLSTTGPLLQAWFARERKDAMPYRLYALSNAGSMFALLSYPILFEPVYTTHQQAWMWSAAYGVFVALCGYVAYRAARVPVMDPVVIREDGERPSRARFALWLLLPACASALLLSISNHMSQNVAAIPFLWVLPLSVYLLSFILCFESKGWYSRKLYMRLLAVALGCMAYAMYTDVSGNIPIKVGVPLFLMGLFTCCMVCHGELAELKPHPRYLTHFYLAISAGGALGGVMVAVVAPLLLTNYYELPLALVACAALAVIVMRKYPTSAPFSELLPAGTFLPSLALIGFGGYVVYDKRDWILQPVHNAMTSMSSQWQAPADFDQRVLAILLLIAGAALIFTARGDIRFRWMRQKGQWAAVAVELLALILAGYVGYQSKEASSGYRVMVRNFYGGMKVKDSGLVTELGSTRTLTHGTINHGEQYLHFARRGLPTTYYGPNTGVGLAIRAKQKTGFIRVGVIGLGTGTLAAYGRPGDYYRFYEINPLVYRLSVPESKSDEPQFTYLRDCKAKWDVAMGDARLSLERENAENFDVLAVDAFSSDSIPVHLLTREAVQLYFRHLRPDGILAIHISNRYLDLEPVVDSDRLAFGKAARVVDTEDDESQGVFGATWILVSAPRAGFDDLILNASAPLKPQRKVRPWTDDYSTMFPILK